jgi:hypothetical protein
MSYLLFQIMGPKKKSRSEIQRAKADGASA